MCGIAGFVEARLADNAAATLQRMCAVIRHRGPDDNGSYLDAWAALGHLRLSIIDVAGGHQPMANAQGNLWVTYNGEIFNHSALGRELIRRGHVYRTRCDTETILHAYEEYGANCLDHFRGMFAFALWDKDRRTLFCARDRLGIKPFYYYWDGRLFAFASEIKALLEHPLISTQLEESALPDYLSFGYSGDERTLFRGIRQLMPGHRLTLRVDTAELAIMQYWDAPRPNTSECDWIEETRRRVEETVQMRMMSDVPLGMFLSGGIDSAAIAAIMKKAGGPVDTFSVGYRESQFSELSAASETARVLGTRHREVLLGIDEFFEALPKLIWHEDSPLAWPSSVPLYCVSKLAASHVKVVLTGEGSDEIFGGYERYLWNLLNQRGLRWYGVLPQTLRNKVRAAIATSRMFSATARRRLSHTFLGREASLESLYLDNFYCAFPPRNYAAFLRYWQERAGDSTLARMLYADQKTYLVELLKKQDRMSMACSIESRVPYLDHTLVEFAASIPDDLKIRGRSQKYVLRQAMSPLLPARLRRRKKMGFPTPLHQWLRDPKAAPVYETLRAKDGLLAEYVDRAEIEKLIARQQSGQEDATDRIWRLLNLETWGRVFLTKSFKDDATSGLGQSSK